MCLAFPGRVLVPDTRYVNFISTLDSPDTIHQKTHWLYAALKAGEDHPSRAKGYNQA